mmetsp:Transcript_7895/g.7396  ORF Transcript_7895/g.7396 Transcript_7895/m.7396 type:complete len:348 (-) Transcript_7895:1552-2595(-)
MVLHLYLDFLLPILQIIKRLTVDATSFSDDAYELRGENNVLSKDPRALIRFSDGSLDGTELLLESFSLLFLLLLILLTLHDFFFFGFYFLSSVLFLLDHLLLHQFDLLLLLFHHHSQVFLLFLKLELFLLIELLLPGFLIHPLSIFAGFFFLQKLHLLPHLIHLPLLMIQLLVLLQLVLLCQLFLQLLPFFLHRFLHLFFFFLVLFFFQLDHFLISDVPVNGVHVFFNLYLRVPFHFHQVLPHLLLIFSFLALRLKVYKHLLQDDLSRLLINFFFHQTVLVLFPDASLDLVEPPLQERVLEDKDRIRPKHDPVQMEETRLRDPSFRIDFDPVPIYQNVLSCFILTSL